MNWRQALTATVAIIAICSSRADAADRPEWVNQPPEDPACIYVVGTSPPSLNEQLGRRASLQDGLKILAERFGVTTSVYFQGDARRGARDVTDAIVSRSEQVEIEGLAIDRVFIDDDHGLKIVYTLLKVPRAAFEKEKQRLEQSRAAMADMPTAVRQLVAAMVASRLGQASILGVATPSTSWAIGGEDPLIEAVREEVLAELARSGVLHVTLNQSQADAWVLPSITLTPAKAISLTLALKRGDRLAWASQAIDIDSSRLPSGLQAHVAQAIQKEALRHREEQVSNTTVLLNVGLVGVNKIQYERIYQVLSAHTEVQAVSRVYYSEGFGRLAVTFGGGTTVAPEALCSVLESCGLSLIDRRDANLIFRQP